MKVLHISRTMGQGGAEKVVYQLCKDINATHYVASCGGEYVSELTKLGIDHIEIPDIDKKSPDLIFKTFRILYLTIKNSGIDIIHTHHRMAAFYGRVLQFFFPKLKHVYTAHNVFFGKKALMRFAIRKASVIACGDTVKKNLIDEYRLQSDCINVIYNSVECNSICNIKIDSLEKAINNDAYLIGSIGRITEQKGFDVFVKAIAACKTEIPNILGVIIGDGSDRNLIHDLVVNEGLEDSILFLGFQKDVISLISKMQFIVLCSRWEGFPLTPIETFSVGKTIIVSDIPNNLEIVKNGVNGLVFVKDDYYDLSNRIVELYNNPTYKKDLEVAAYRDYIDKYDYHIFINKYSLVYAS